MSRWIAGGLATLAVVMLAGCGKPVPATGEIGSALKPPRPPVTAAQLLPYGRESIYDLVNTGTYRAADDLLRDVWDVPRFAPVTLKSPLTWQEDPYHSSYWRFVFQGMRPTANLLWAYYRSGQARYRDKLIEILRGYATTVGASTSDQIPINHDPHAMAFRAMVLVNTYVKLRRSGDLPADLAGPLRRSIGSLGRMLATPENYQGFHNHGFTEAAALLLVGVNFPDLDRGGGWQRLARERLSAMMRVTVDADGVQIEKSPFYHFYVLDFALQVERWARANSIGLPAGFHERVESMLRYATYIIWPDGTVPLSGSSVRLRPRRHLADLYAGIVREHPDFGYAVTAGRSGTAPGDRAVLFARSGHAVLRSPAGGGPPADNSQILMDTGPVRTKHSHHEALSVAYYSAGSVLLVDSGLYTYNAGQAYTYFHGTAAHNTVLVDGRDQDGGPVAAGRTVAGGGWAYQSGLARVYRGVTHRRAVLLLRRDLAVVVDEITATGTHTYEQLWHVFPGAHVLTGRDRTRVFDAYDNPALDIVQARQVSDARPRVRSGAFNPMQGWYSDRYGQLQPINVVGYQATARGAVYLTLLASGPYAGQGATVTGSVSGALTRASVCAGGYTAAVLIDNLADRGEQVSVRTGGRCPGGS